ncbi:group II intron reverse transcriptase/maturase [Clostridium tagluense]|uniref:group II intron reverse transcriptase/maturase n=1 Tax=Clostridium tagluense TaxID=360422 RepID=UPI001CF3DB6A|nr:group II intron reverse transcriptase/maturase [Clostridium tagluense]MCB2314268.1 group II intron reverse transcriptase/maturase [Clostridium tagluense]MCB2318820.1 group II intron reverse transcriptase/maturase [Clostridium tagluense]MCB2324012.1 group II intron reverse transcriptase/maturase [Clostridium tagluense]MCB2328860.1 group II intron reverse transcriptase/maturase [Clostridium tagluense]MCB2333711.1 group II intron reverse transcriptase/maturase [Clostridium tagluense]
MRNTSLIMKSTLPNNITWKQINWIHVYRYVEKLQQRIYRAESLGNKRKVKELQRLLMHSKSALILSIKRITQINKGKKTAGVDGFTVLTDGERIKLFRKMIDYQISLHHPKPSYRTYIKKKNGKLRPLSIPTIKDRIYQNIAKMALEPQWEVRFEPTSYGFRPKRGCHDAIERIFKSCSQRKKRWIFEGDFKGCFDNLSHDYIMKQIEDFPGKAVTERWLKAGYVDNNVFNRTGKGSGQGSVISPLLANIALHGMEEQLGIKYKTRVKSNGYQYVNNTTRYAMTRYADDFAIMCKTKEGAEEIYDKLKPYLELRGIELEPSKTRVVEITEGFDFLSFNIRIYQTSTGEKLLIKPSKEAVKKSMRQISDKVHELNGHKIGKVINMLNPIIIGKANYWRPMVSKETFSKMDFHLYKVNRRFLERLHPKKPAKWINQRYYKAGLTGKSKNKWILTDPIENRQLKRMMQIPIIRHTMIKHTASPYDSTLGEYFKMRDNKYNDKTKIQDK